VRALWVVLRKELLDAFRDRRMVAVAFVVMPLAVPLILGGTAALGARKQAAQFESTLELPVLGAEHAPNLVEWLEQHNLEVVAAPSDPDAAVRTQRHDVVLRIDANYAEEWRAGQPASR
jgi:sodium transport system permease protein